MNTDGRWLEREEITIELSKLRKFKGLTDETVARAIQRQGAGTVQTSLLVASGSGVWGARYRNESVYNINPEVMTARRLRRSENCACLLGSEGSHERDCSLWLPRAPGDTFPAPTQLPNNSVRDSRDSAVSASSSYRAPVAEATTELSPSSRLIASNILRKKYYKRAAH